MESLNMSRLNLTSALSPPPIDDETEPKTVQVETNYVADPSNEFYCEYNEDIWQHMLKQEAERPTIHLRSPQLKFRGTLVNLMRAITKKLDLRIGTLHSAVAQLDLFMDSHVLRADRLIQITLACISLSAKSEEKFSQAPSLKTLRKLTGLSITGEMFRQLEWMVGQHVKWRLLAPTPATFASLLAQYVVADSDLITRHPKFVRKFRRDGAKLLEAYLDLSLSDARLKIVDSVDVGCACVACARADLGLCAWPPWLANIAKRKVDIVAPVTRLLQRMMQLLKARKGTDPTLNQTPMQILRPLQTQVQMPALIPLSTPMPMPTVVQLPTTLQEDQGYGSARTTPNGTPCTSPRYSNTQPPCIYTTANLNAPNNCMQGSTTDRNYYMLPNAGTSQRVDNPADYSYCRSSRLLDASLEVVAATSMGVKRGLDDNVDLERKRNRITQVAQ